MTPPGAPRFPKIKMPWVKGWTKRVHLSRLIVILLIAASVVSSILTYIAFTRLDPLTPSSGETVLLLNIDLILLAGLGLMISRRLAKLWAEKKRGAAGSRLHIRMVLLFGLLTVAPTLFAALFSGLYLNTGVQTWFHHKVRTALHESTAIADAYLEEHKKVIRAGVDTMAREIGAQFPFLNRNPDLFNEALDVQSNLRSLQEAIVFSVGDQGRIFARSRLTFALEFAQVPVIDLERSHNAVVIHAEGDRVRALTQIPGYDAYLLVGRFIDPGVLKRIKQVHDAVSDYHKLEHLQSDIILRFFLLFTVLALIMLMISVWVGLTFASQMAKPISALIEAAERVGSGDFSVRVLEKHKDDELSLLSRSFNRMTAEIQNQQSALLDANAQVDNRRRFIEDVLSGVKAGVMELSKTGSIRLSNESAIDLLNLPPVHQILGQNLPELVPEMGPPLESALANTKGSYQGELLLDRQKKQRVLMVRIARAHSKDQGFILTFDDVTDLMNAQRKAAWADVAQRIAHEIKNPLTPIQLSAERLRRKYLPRLKDDSEAFESCVETIIRQVDHIGRMVSEFSGFARMPGPVLANQDLVKLLENTLFLEQESNPHISYTLTVSPEIGGKGHVFLCDANQLGQVFTNILQNARDSIDSRHAKNKTDPTPKEITLFFDERMGDITLIFRDTGEGFPPENRASLIEPYVTRKEKGTGLGLAIVKKIVEDHGGILFLEDNPNGGAEVRLTFHREQT